MYVHLSYNNSNAWMLPVSILLWFHRPSGFVCLWAAEKQSDESHHMVNTGFYSWHLLTLNPEYSLMVLMVCWILGPIFSCIFTLHCQLTQRVSNSQRFLEFHMAYRFFCFVLFSSVSKSLGLFVSKVTLPQEGKRDRKIISSRHHSQVSHRGQEAVAHS